MKEKLLLLLSLLSYLFSASQTHTYTIGVWDGEDTLITQKIINKNKKEIISFLHMMINSLDSTLVASRQIRKYFSQPADNEMGRNVYYVYVGDTVIKDLRKVKFPYAFTTLTINFIHFNADSDNQKIMVDNLLPGKWFEFWDSHNKAILKSEKNIKNYLLNGPLMIYSSNNDTICESIFNFENGIEKESFTFFGDSNTITTIDINENAISQSNLITWYEKGRIVKVMRYENQVWKEMLFDSEGRLIKNTLFEQ
jgi:antitoxin component YwqK of YwqJK toxin-antitoxin module